MSDYPEAEDKAEKRSEQIKAMLAQARALSEARDRIIALEGEKERLIKQVEEASKVAGQNMTGRQLAEEANTKLQEQVKSYKDDDFELRCMVAIAFSGSKLYTDDGELQDNSEPPFIDYKRDTVEEIHTKIFQRRQPEIKAAFEEVMRKQSQDTQEKP